MNTHEITTTDALTLLGFRCKIWPCGEFAGTSLAALEITDMSTAATVYVPECSTLEHCVEMIQAKNAAFKRAGMIGKNETMVKPE